MAFSADTIQFVLNAETGVLEDQAILACASLRAFGGSIAGARITVVSPRKDRRPGPESMARLAELGVDILPLDLASPYPESDVSYKPMSLAHVEALSGPPLIVQMDSDTLVLDDPAALLIAGGAAARPVGGKSISTAGAGDPADGFWRAACDLLGVCYDGLPAIRTTVSGLTVKANYNGGLLVGRRDLGLFRRTAEVIRSLVKADIFPPHAEKRSIRTGTGLVEGAAARFFGMDQAAFSLACAASRTDVEILPAGYNYPVQMLEHMPDPVPTPLVHLHYHTLASRPLEADNPLASARLALAPDRVRWLKARLPLRGLAEAPAAAR